MDLPEQLPAREVIDDPPPFLGTWRRVYIAILGYLIVLILALYGFMQLFQF